MKQQGLFSDFIYQVFSLIISLIVVHAIYVAIIWPNSNAVLAQQAVMLYVVGRGQLKVGPERSHD